MHQGAFAGLDFDVASSFTVTGMEWSIHDIARAAGTTSRTLRHYDQLGLLAPDRIGRNGYRYYGQDSMIRLQRILLLRELGLSLSTIAEVLDGQQDPQNALITHLKLLQVERERLDRQIDSVSTTLRKVKGGQQLMPAEVFGGFDHAQYKDEVITKYGHDAWEKSDMWWTSLSDVEKTAWQQSGHQISVDFGRAAATGMSADSDEVQAITARHLAWLSATADPTKDYVIGLGDMYVADSRFAEFYDKHGPGTAVLVRDAMKIYAQHNL